MLIMLPKRKVDTRSVSVKQVVAHETGISSLTSLIGLLSKILHATNKQVIETTWKRCLVISFPKRKRSKYARAMVAVPRDIEKSSDA